MPLQLKSELILVSNKDALVLVYQIIYENTLVILHVLLMHFHLITYKMFHTIQFLPFNSIQSYKISNYIIHLWPCCWEI
jgi:hypothetical protein